MVKLLKDFFTKADERKQQTEFIYQTRFRIKFTVVVCKCAAHEFTKNKHYYQHKNDPIAEMSKKENDFFILFRNTYKNIARENTAAVWFGTEIFDWVLESVMTKSGHMIFRAVIADKSSWFDTKQTFLNKIWIDIGENKNFQEYLEYLDSQSAYLVKKIREYVSLIMNEKDSMNDGKTKLETMIESELNKYSVRITAILEELVQCAPFENQEEYFAKLKIKFGNTNTDNKYETALVYPERSFKILESMELTDFVGFTQMLIDRMPLLQQAAFDIIKNRIKSKNGRYDPSELVSNLDFANGTDPVDLLREKVLGCKEQCPFCKTPCKYTCKNHAGSHNALQHCPSGVRGIYHRDDLKLLTMNCQSAVTSDAEFTLGKSGVQVVPFKEYKQCYPGLGYSARSKRWNHRLYWKWFMNAFHDDLVKHFKVKHADIPKEWKLIQWEDAKKSLFEDS